MLLYMKRDTQRSRVIHLTRASTFNYVHDFREEQNATSESFHHRFSITARNNRAQQRNVTSIT